MEAVLKTIREKKLRNVEPALIVASQPCDALEKARRMGVDAASMATISPKRYDAPAAFGRAIIEACRARRVNFVGQYGWLPKTPDNVIEEFEGVIVNHHPGPLDPLTDGYDFGGKGMYGRRVISARLQFVQEVHREYWTYATVHRVTSKLDRGEVVCEKAVPIGTEETVESLLQKVQAAEREAAVEVLRDFANGTVRTITRKPHWLVEPKEKHILNRVKDLAIMRYEDG